MEVNRWTAKALISLQEANGSVRVKLGATDVIAGVKAELGKPNHLQPDKGKVAIFVDCSPTAAPMFEVDGTSSHEGKSKVLHSDYDLTLSCICYDSNIFDFNRYIAWLPFPLYLSVSERLHVFFRGNKKYFR